MPQDRQPDVSDTLRLKKYDGHYERFLAPYQDPYIYYNSEGILDDARKPPPPLRGGGRLLSVRLL